LLRGFYVPIDSGGFTYKEPGGWWYEELADTNKISPYILDGHIFAMLGVYEYGKQTKSDSAIFVFEKGVQALKERLPLYSAGGGWSYYDKYHKRSDKKYHRILTGQMGELWRLTNDPFFKKMYDEWRAPLEKAYALRMLEERNRSGLLLILFVTCCSFGILLILLKLIR